MHDEANTPWTRLTRAADAVMAYVITRRLGGAASIPHPLNARCYEPAAPELSPFDVAEIDEACDFLQRLGCLTWKEPA